MITISKFFAINRHNIVYNVLQKYKTAHNCGFYLKNRRQFSSIFTYDSTIYALSSGHGKCGVAVIRVSGEKSAEVFHKMTKRKHLPRSREVVLTSLIDHRTGDKLDKALVLWFPGPNSFTGEDVCEFHVHGGTAVIASVFNALSSIQGLRPAEPGDYTKRAFLNNKLDLTEVEGLGDLIHAETEEQRKQALCQMEGGLSRMIGSWSKEVLRCLAHVEAYIDFGEDQHIEEKVLDEVQARISKLCQDVKRHLDDKRRGERLRNGVRLAIVGEPNVGKSSLLNLITERPAAIVSPIAGTTRDVVETALNIGGYPVILSDTAGLRATHDAVEKEGVKRAMDKAKQADLLLYLVDLSKIDEKKNFLTNIMNVLVEHLNQNEEVSDEDYMPQRENTIIILNKCDLLSENHIEILRKSITELPFHHTVMSCRTQQGLSEILATLQIRIKELCTGDTSLYSPSLTQQRHRTHVTRCLEDLENALAIINLDIVLAAEYLRFAMNQLGKLTGKIGAEEILDVIFKDFCIGK